MLQLFSLQIHTAVVLFVVTYFLYGLMINELFEHIQPDLFAYRLKVVQDFQTVNNC